MSSSVIWCVEFPLTGDRCSQVVMNMQCGAVLKIHRSEKKNFWLVLDTSLKIWLTYSPAIQIISLQLFPTIHSRNQMFNSPSKKSRVNVHEMAECIPTVIERLISLHGVHSLPIIWQFGSYLASCSDMNISCPSCYWALSKDFHKSVTKVNSFDYGLSMGSAPNWLRRWYRGMKRTVHWKWGFHAHIVSADGTSADQQSSWSGLERHEDQTLFCSSICELAHILAINPKMQNIFVLLLWGFIHRLLHFYQ